jgi:hypothetical protein
MRARGEEGCTLAVQGAGADELSRKLPGPIVGFKWTDEDNELVRSLWIAGVSAGKITARLTNGATRNAVIGKVNRAGLARKNAGKQPVAKPKAEPKPRAEKPKPKIVNPTTESAVFEHIEFTAPAGGLTIMELAGYHCRYIEGAVDGLNTRYCGGGSVAGSSYCQAHRKLTIGFGTYAERKAGAGEGVKKTRMQLGDF